MKKLLIFIVFIILIPSLKTVKAQINEPDILLYQLESHLTKDTTRVKLLVKNAYHLLRKDKSKSLEYAQEAIVLADSLNYHKGMGLSLKVMATSYRLQSNFKQALDYYLKSALAFEQAGDQYSISQIYNNIGGIHWYLGNFEETKLYFEKSLPILTELNDKKKIASVLSNIGLINQSLGDYDKALDYLQKSLEVCQEIDDQKGSSNALVGIGVVYKVQGDFPRALECYQQALSIQDKLGDKKGMSQSISNIGSIYKSQGDNTMAMEYFNRSLKLYQELEDMHGEASIYNNFGEVYKLLENYSEALKYFEKSLQIRTELAEKSQIAHSYINIGEVYCNQKDYTKALNYFQKSIQISKKIGSNSNLAKSYSALGILYLNKGRYSDAYKNSKQAYILAEQLGNVELIMQSTEILAQSCALLGFHKEAYNFHVIFKEMQDSIFNEENANNIAKLEYQYQFEKEKQAIELEQQKKEAIQSAELKKQKLAKNYSIAAFILVLLLAIVIYRNFLQKRRANIILNKQNLKIEEKNEKLKNQNAEILDQNKLIKLNTKMILQLKNERHDMELASRKKDMEELHLNNQMKIKMKEDLVEQMLKLKKQKSDIQTEIRTIINNLKYQIEEEKNIGLLQNSIDEVGNDFVERLKLQFSDLTKSDIELLSFVKLKMSNKQIAIQKNTSPNTINVALHRLKSKCNFETTNELKSFIGGF